MFPAKFISSLGQIPSEMVSAAETTQTSAGTFLTQRTAGAEVRRGFIKNKKIKIIKEMRQGCWGAWGSLTVAGGHNPAPHHFQNPDLQFPETTEASLSIDRCTPFLHSHPQARLCLPGVLLCILPDLLHVASSGKPSSPPTFEGVLCCAVLQVPVAPCPPVSRLLLLNHNRLQFVFFPVSSLRPHSSLLFWFLASCLAQSQSQ